MIQIPENSITTALSISNYLELETASKQLAIEEYEENKDSKVYQYFMARYNCPIEDFIEILSNSHMIKLALQYNAYKVAKLHSQILLNFRYLFRHKSDELEMSTFNFFTELIDRNYK